MLGEAQEYGYMPNSSKYVTSTVLRELGPLQWYEDNYKALNLPDVYQVTNHKKDSN